MRSHAPGSAVRRLCGISPFILHHLSWYVCLQKAKGRKQYEKLARELKSEREISEQKEKSLEVCYKTLPNSLIPVLIYLRNL